MSYSLLDEAWVPVLRLDGTPGMLSLHQCFQQASAISKIAAELPTQSFAVLRLLLAICHDAIGFHSDDDMETLYHEGFDLKKIADYLEQWRHRFDLLDSSQPFYQVSDLRTAKGQTAGLEKLICDVPNNEQFLTTRRGAALQAIPAAEAALWVLHCQAFDPSGLRSGAVGDPLVKAGKGSPIGPSWPGQIGGLVLHGRNLAETLAFNLVPTEPNPADRPIWTRPPQTAQRSEEIEPAGPVDLLTWQSRRIRLVGDKEAITGLVLAQGDKMTPQNRHNVEAMTAWRYSQPQSKKAGRDVYMPLKHDPARASWRGLPGILSANPQLRDGRPSTRRPETLSNLSIWSQEFNKLDSFTLEIVGMQYGSNESTVAELVNDTLDLRISLLGEQALSVRSSVEGCIQLAEDAVKKLGDMAANIARAGGNQDGADTVRTDTATQAWAAIDTSARSWLAQLSATSDLDVIETDWQQLLRRILTLQAQVLANQSTPAALRGRKTKYGFMTTAKAEKYFHFELRKLLPLAYPKKEDHE